ncbi:hypothetical protein cyc_03358 [Cyclospora cayetanensis]|uniref:Uncharacterized protein n=1 Tax=Cyclospora cayetanensis TaxID=88456 RepID=A0A1D3CUW1_9EIME|nr:hypothetical protein cyc_03358 [Cyclospora cayetanensis]
MLIPLPTHSTMALYPLRSTTQRESSLQWPGSDEYPAAYIYSSSKALIATAAVIMRYEASGVGEAVVPVPSMDVGGTVWG